MGQAHSQAELAEKAQAEARAKVEAANKKLADYVAEIQDPGAGMTRFQGYAEGTRHIPFRCKGKKAPDLRTDVEAEKPVLVNEAKVAVLNLADPGDLKIYQFIWSEISRGAFVLSDEEKEYDDSVKSWRVLIRYGVSWLEMKA